MSGTDAVVRAMTDDGSLRVVALNTTHSVTAVVGAQNVNGEVARLMGELVTGAVLSRETMAPDHRFQAILRVDGGSVVADSHSDGMVRGLVQQRNSSGTMALAKGATLQVQRMLPRGRFTDSIVGADPETGVSGALMEYMQTSEQVVSTIVVRCEVTEGKVVAAGGYIVQLLPELSRDVLEDISARLERYDLTDWLLDGAADPEGLIGTLLAGMPYTILERSTARFGCVCSSVRVLSALSAVGRDELASMIAEGKVVELGCDYCGKQYEVPPSQLQSLLDSN